MSSRTDPFDALADPTRRAVLELLRTQGTTTAGEIAAAFPAISRPAVSRHLRVLRESGFVSARSEGREWHYDLDGAGLARVYFDWFAQFAPIWEDSLERLKRQVESQPEEERLHGATRESPRRHTKSRVHLQQ